MNPMYPHQSRKIPMGSMLWYVMTIIAAIVLYKYYRGLFWGFLPGVAVGAALASRHWLAKFAKQHVANTLNSGYPPAYDPGYGHRRELTSGGHPSQTFPAVGYDQQGYQHYGGQYDQDYGQDYGEQGYGEQPDPRYQQYAPEYVQPQVNYDPRTGRPGPPAPGYPHYQ